MNCFSLTTEIKVIWVHDRLIFYHNWKVLQRCCCHFLFSLLPKVTKFFLGIVYLNDHVCLMLDFDGPSFLLNLRSLEHNLIQRVFATLIFSPPDLRLGLSRQLLIDFIWKPRVNYERVSRFHNFTFIGHWEPWWLLVYGKFWHNFS